MGELREDQELEALLNFLRARNGYDFSGYKRSNLRRRIEKRMRALDIEGFGDYRALLEANPHELVPLFNAILINVSAFFRDQDVWTFVSTQVVPRVLEGKPATSSIRVWSAGCAGGQEPYTLAMVLAEIMGLEECCRRVKIYATDLDQGALDRAREARYDSHALESVPEALRAKYFQNDEGGFVFHAGLRRSVIFGRHDLVADRPVSHVDMLFCRNTLMYFNVNAQTRILMRFRDALNQGGFLIIGRAEMLFSKQRLFAAVHLQHGVYSNTDALLGSGKSSHLQRPGEPASEQERDIEDEAEVAREKLAALGAELASASQALDRARAELAVARSVLTGIMTSVPFGIWVVDAELTIRLWNDRASEIWGLDSEVAVGRSLLELAIGLPVTELEAPLRACAERGEGNHQVTVDAQRSDGRVFRCHLTVTGLPHDRAVHRGAIVLTSEGTQ